MLYIVLKLHKLKNVVEKLEKSFLVCLEVQKLPDNDPAETSAGSNID